MPVYHGKMCSINIEGTNVYAKSYFTKMNFSLTDIIRVERKEPSALAEGYIDIAFRDKKSLRLWYNGINKKDFAELYSIFKESAKTNVGETDFVDPDTKNKKVCAICGRKLGAMSFKVELLDAFICYPCSCGLSDFKDPCTIRLADIERFKQKILRDNLYKQKHAPTDKVENLLFFYEFDKVWATFIKAAYNQEYYLFKCSDIANYELIEDGQVITKGGLGSAAVGTILFGGAGMITGGILGKKNKDIVSNMIIRISTKDEFCNHVEIVLLSKETRRGNIVYKDAKETAIKILSLLDKISSISIPSNTGAGGESFSAADEIMKFKNLLDSGIISEEEFEAKKKQLLNI